MACDDDDDDDDDDDVLTWPQFPWNLARGHKTGWNIFDGRKNKQVYTK